jgi:hypothetical protein
MAALVSPLLGDGDGDGDDPVGDDDNDGVSLSVLVVTTLLSSTHDVPADCSPVSMSHPHFITRIER